MKKNRWLFIGLGVFAFLMFAFAFANVPLYRMVCQRLGIAIAPDTENIKRLESGESGRKIKVRFSGLVASGLPVHFDSEEAIQTVELGKQAENKYTFENLSNDTIRFRPIHSVLPEDAASKLDLIKCFCFDDQTLLPKQKMELPVIYTFGADLKPEITYVTMHYTLFPKPLDDRNK